FDRVRLRSKRRARYEDCRNSDTQLRVRRPRRVVRPVVPSLVGRLSPCAEGSVADVTIKVGIGYPLLVLAAFAFPLRQQPVLAAAVVTGLLVALWIMVVRETTRSVKLIRAILD